MSGPARAGGRRTATLVAAVALALLLLPTLAQARASGTRARTAELLPLAQVTTWAYQIQGLERAGAVTGLRGAGYDLLVVEPTRTQRGSGGFDTAAIVASLKSGVTAQW